MTLSGDPKETPRGTDLLIYVKDLRQEGKRRSVKVKSWATIKDVKNTIQSCLDLPSNLQRLYFGPLLSSGCELPNRRSLHDVGIYKSGETLLLDLQRSGTPSDSVHVRSSGAELCISPSMTDATTSDLKAIIQSARRGFAVGLKPQLVLDGSGGTYYMHDARKNKIAVFKPADEEPYAENNPRGYLQQPGGGLSLRRGIAPGEACIREVAAYLLDHASFASVPMTTLAEAAHPAFNTNGAALTVAEGGAAVGWHSKTSCPTSVVARKAGSFQEFVRGECTMDDLSFSKISKDQVHKIAILDIRIMNADRNSANLLCRRRRDNTLELVPIDHGYCLRSVCDVSWMDWCWLDWPQLKEPLSEHSREYILSLDIEKDAQMLHDRLNICEEAIDNFRASSLLLQAGVRAGLSLYDIAIMCCRNDDLGEVPSRLEVLSNMASEIALRAIDNDRWHHSTVSRALVDQLSPSAGGENSRSRMAKSMSSVEFGTLSNTKTLSEEVSPEAESSSGSDTSSEISHDAACEEWAATVIADVSMDHTMTRPARSSSIFSDDGSQDDSFGFWKVAPGSSPCFSDDASGFSSPHHSPCMSGRGSVDLAPHFTLESPISSPKNPKQKVSFSFANEGPFIPPKTVDVETVLTTKPTIDFPAVVRTDSGMGRSKSYSALSSMSFDQTEAPKTGGRASKPVDPAKYRQSFLNFIDLMMVREATMAANLKATAS